MDEIQRKAIANLTSVVDSKIYSGYRVSHPDGGLWVQHVEKELKATLGVQYGVLCSSASTGLYMALKACGIGFSDHVLVPANTMSSTAAAVAMCGATPIFVDCDPRTGLTTLNSTVEAFDWCKEEYSRPPTAMILVHIHGQAHSTSAYRVAFPDMKIIEDCAQALGCREPLTDWFVGTIGHAGVYSFKQGKSITCGEGGFVGTNDRGVHQNLRLLRNHGEIHSQDILGFNFHMTELQAAVLSAEFGGLQAILSSRYKSSKTLSFHLKNNKHFLPMIVRNPPFIYFLLADDAHYLPKGFTRGYHKPLCCVPWYKSNVRQPCCLNSHIFAATMLWTRPPESADQISEIEAAIAESICTPST